MAIPPLLNVRELRKPLQLFFILKLLKYPAGCHGHILTFVELKIELKILK